MQSIHCEGARIDAKLAIMSVAARLFAELEIFRAEHPDYDCKAPSSTGRIKSCQEPCRPLTSGRLFARGRPNVGYTP